MTRGQMIQSSQAVQASGTAPPTLATERLILRGWEPDDFEPYASICADTRVMRFVGAGRSLNRAQVGERIGPISKAWGRNGFGPLSVIDAQTSQFIGLCGLSIPSYASPVMPAVEIGWRLGHDSWGQGYATEAATAALDWAFSALNLAAVLAIIQTGNRRAERVATKLAMTRIGTMTLGSPLKNQPLRVFRVTGGEWLAPR